MSSTSAGGTDRSSKTAQGRKATQPEEIAGVTFRGVEIVSFSGWIGGIDGGEAAALDGRRFL